MPAVLPRPRREKDVKTAIGAARAKQAREADARERGKSEWLRTATWHGPREGPDGARVEDDTGETPTTNQGRIQNNQDSLKGGRRGPTLLEDFHLREKITHFDHERIPERVVHARGSAAHGFFQVYKSLPR